MAGTITRKGWGARNPKDDPTRLSWTQIDAIVIHYSAAFSDELPDYKLRVRGIQNYHMNTKGWNDIAYNKLVSRAGDKFEGRGYGVMSAATLNHNDHTQAICFLGADKVGRDDVTDKGRRAISELIFEAERMKGQKVGVKLLVKGHRDFVSTDCPGDELYHFVMMRGWNAYRKPKKYPYPSRFFQWASWYLGEGEYKQYGRRAPGRRPNVPMPLTPVYWAALKHYLKARKNRP